MGLALRFLEGTTPMRAPKSFWARVTIRGRRRLRRTGAFVARCGGSAWLRGTLFFVSSSLSMLLFLLAVRFIAR